MTTQPQDVVLGGSGGHDAAPLAIRQLGARDFWVHTAAS
jgi:hypothetical protein